MTSMKNVYLLPVVFSSKWTPEDDKQLLEVVRIVGLGNWRRGNVIYCVLMSVCLLHDVVQFFS